jgi:predicted permease
MLAIAEVALACMLLVGAGLLIQSVRTMRATGLGFDTSRLLSVRVDLRSDRYTDDAVVRQTADRLLEAAAAIPGLDDAFLWSPSPLGGGNWVAFFTHPGAFDIDPLARVEASRHHVYPGALGQLGVAIIRGRDFTDADAPDAPPVAIVSEALARTFWGDGQAVGQRLETRYRGAREIVEVVGVAADARHRSRLEDPFGPQRDVYLSYRQHSERFLSLLLRPHAGISDAAVVSAARLQVQRVDPTLPLYDVSTLDDRMRQEEAHARLSTLLMSLYAGLALGLAVLGVYGVLAYAVRLQRREIGIRLALGARVSDVVGGVVRRGLQLIVVGAVLGSAAALATTRLMTSLLFGVGPRDPVVFAVAAAALAAVATAACVLPARAAATVDPVDALRQP